MFLYETVNILSEIMYEIRFLVARLFLCLAKNFLTDKYRHTYDNMIFAYKDNITYECHMAVTQTEKLANFK